jgi:hypothetical protein
MENAVAPNGDKLWVNSCFLFFGVWLVFSHLLLLPLAICGGYGGTHIFTIQRCKEMQIWGRGDS